MRLFDTGPVVAALDADDSAHGLCRGFFEKPAGPIHVPAPCVTEICYLIARNLGSKAESRFVRTLSDTRFTRVVDLIPADYLRISELVEQYGDFPASPTRQSSRWPRGWAAQRW